MELRGEAANDWWYSQPGTFEVFAESTLTRECDDEATFELFFEPVDFVFERQEISPGVIVREGSFAEAQNSEWIAKEVARCRRAPCGLIAKLQGEPGEEGYWGEPYSLEDIPHPLDTHGAMRLRGRPKRSYLYEVATYEGVKEGKSMARLENGSSIAVQGTTSKAPGDAVLLSLVPAAPMTPVQATLAAAHNAKVDRWEAKLAGWNAADRALALSQPTAKKARLSTGFAPLDTATRGGFPVGKLVVIGGAPGAGKTTLLVQTAYRYAVAGHHVAILAIDESADDILVRLGQMMGFDRTLLEDHDEATLVKVAAALRGLNLLLVDGDEDGSTVEIVSDELARRADGAPSALFVDSLQRIRFPPGDSRSRLDSRALLNAATDVVKLAAKKHLVVATSELTRGSYRSQVAAEQVNDLAAFKESGNIEYAAQFAMVLKSRKGSNVIDVTVPKNRLGPKCEGFALELDASTASFFHSLNTKSSADEEEERLLGPALKRIRTFMIEKGTGRSFTKTALVTSGGAEKPNAKAVDWLLDHNELAHDPQGLLRDSAELSKGLGIKRALA